MRHQFVSQFAQFGHGQNEGVSQRVIVVETALFFAKRGRFFFQFDVEWAQKISIVSSRDYFMPLEIIDVNHTLQILDERKHHLSSRLSRLRLFRSTFAVRSLLFMDQWIHVSLTITKRHKNSAGMLWKGIDWNFNNRLIKPAATWWWNFFVIEASSGGEAKSLLSDPCKIIIFSIFALLIIQTV